ncbi:MAG: glucose-1-phosphate cytidylyltransferase [Actinomycetia bacterium]|nr:glucose-1-phosphate cytidylyltransferase [Actinomycetes bacterium]MCP4960671.1 glucose-1-phosphate cytidylyltransferase [Actinomycetes bacterium]
MKVGILAGGLGTRLSEETELKPKPMVEIGGRPILWHIMQYYGHHGFNEFVVACGYKADYIKRWFSDAVSTTGNLTVDFAKGEVQPHGDRPSGIDFRVDLVDTGLPTATGGRIKRLQPYLGEGTFMVTWGDGVSNVDLHELLAYHKSHGKLATLTAVRPPARFGHMEMDGNRILEFNEKPQTGEGWINGAFFVFEPGVFDYIDGDDIMFEREPLEGLAKDGQLMAFKHHDFWQCMDTVRDKKRLEDLWTTGAPWKLWS